MTVLKEGGIIGSLSEGAVGVADWGSAKVVDSGFPCTSFAWH